MPLNHIDFIKKQGRRLEHMIGTMMYTFALVSQTRALPHMERTQLFQLLDI